MSIVFNDSIQGKNDVPSVTGSPVGFKSYSTLPTLPDPNLPAGTMVWSSVDSTHKRVDAAGTAWEDVGSGSGGGMTAPAYANFGSFPDPSTVPETFAYATDTNRIYTAQSIGHGSFAWIVVTPADIPIFTITGIKTGSYNAGYWETVRGDTSGGTFPVNLPTAATPGLQIKVKLITGGSPLVITPAPAETIDLMPSLAISSTGDSLTLEADGASNWMVFA